MSYSTSSKTKLSFFSFGTYTTSLNLNVRKDTGRCWGGVEAP